MTLFEKLTIAKENSETKAARCLARNELYLYHFWKNAAIGFQQKIDKLTIEEAEALA